MTEPAPVQKSRSTLVTIIAWLGIVGGGFGLLAMVPAFASGRSMYTLGLLATSAIGLVASIGLLRRRNWARLSFIGVQCFAIANSAYRLIRPESLTAALQQSGVSREQAQAAMASMASMRGAMIIPTLLFMAVNALILAKLLSRSVREEFDAL